MAFENEQEKNKLELEFTNLETQHLWPLLFHQIKQESMKNDYTIYEARKPENRYLNRYRDVNPYDHSRVILSRDEYNYVNASFIDVKEARRKYILTQGPLPNTIIHFWLMVWEQNSKAVIMLNKVIEKDQTKCSQYWPNAAGEDHALLLPQVDLKVELLSEKDSSHYVVRTLRLTNVQCNESRDIMQYHYTTWPDFGVPQNPLAFLKFLRDIRQSGAFKSDVGPPIVHCSAGIGRSGTFCLVDSCLVLMNEKGIEYVSVKDVLLEIRTFRMGLIQTPDQLRFSYIALIQGLKVDWAAHDDDGLPKDEVSFLKNGDSTLNSKLDNHKVSQRDEDNGSSDEDPPPLPPPRDESTRWKEKPLPGPPSESITESSDVDSCSVSSNDLNEEEAHLTMDPTSSEDNRTLLNSSKTVPSQEAVLGSVSEIRKRKYSDDVKDKSKRVFEKVQEMKKKQKDEENRKKKRSILINLILGVGFVVISSTVIAFCWYRKSF